MSQEAGGYEGILFLGIFRDTIDQLIAGQLFMNKLVVGLIRIERANDIVSIPPGPGAILIPIEAIAITVANNIKPLAGPVLAVGREASRRSTSFS